MKIIFDCDPGLDDGIALLTSFSYKGFDIKAVTTAFGCSTLENTTRNALRLMDFLGRKDVKVAMGAFQSMLGKTDIAPYVHGEDGFKNINLPETDIKPYTKNAAETIYETAMESEEKITIVATGPLTNIGTALKKYPELKDKIEKVSIMGGAVGIGNKSPVAEANISNDPEAARILFESGIPVIMSGLNMTFNALVYDDEIEEIAALGNKEAKLGGDFLRAHREFYRKQNFAGDPPHDICAVAQLIKPEIFETVHCHVDVETKGEFTRGETVADLKNKFGKEKNAFVAVGVNRKKFIEFIKERLSAYKEGK